MAKIKIQDDYNWFQILKNAGIDVVVDEDKYQFNKDKNELNAHVSQSVLDKALQDYDHESWLEDLSKTNEKKKTDRELIEELETDYSDTVFELMMEKARNEEQDSEISELWFELMTGGN